MATSRFFKSVDFLPRRGPALFEPLTYILPPPHRHTHLHTDGHTHTHTHACVHTSLRLSKLHPHPNALKRPDYVSRPPWKVSRTPNPGTGVRVGPVWLLFQEQETPGRGDAIGQVPGSLHLKRDPWGTGQALSIWNWEGWGAQRTPFAGPPWGQH